VTSEESSSQYNTTSIPLLDVFGTRMKQNMYIGVYEKLRG